MIHTDKVKVASTQTVFSLNLKNFQTSYSENFEVLIKIKKEFLGSRKSAKLHFLLNLYQQVLVLSDCLLIIDGSPHCTFQSTIPLSKREARGKKSCSEAEMQTDFFWLSYTLVNLVFLDFWPFINKTSHLMMFLWAPENCNGHFFLCLLSFYNPNIKSIN